MIIPTIQTDSVADLQHKLDAYAAIDLPHKPTHFQIDINDGFFSPDFSVQPSDLRHINWHGFTHEYHLLVDHPDEYLGEVSGTGATTVIAHIEHLIDRQNFIATAKQLKLKVGFALDFYTPVSALDSAQLHQLDLVLLMSYKAGHSGLSFNPQVITKITHLRQLGFTQMIEIDGGINPSNIPSLQAAGATAFAVNSYLWHDNHIKIHLQELLAAHDHHSPQQP